MSKEVLEAVRALRRQIEELREMRQSFLMGKKRVAISSSEYSEILLELTKVE